MTDKDLTLILVPLDERPVNTRYPQMLGAIGGATVLLPEPAIGGKGRIPSDRDAVASWLRATPADSALVSTDFLAFGNLINARISQDSAADALSHLRLLEELQPKCRVHAFSLITRVSNADDNVEEPEYWSQWGTKFYRFARLTHQSERGELSTDESRELEILRQTIPAEFMDDWLTRRLRNHTVNLGLIDMAARGAIESLLITSDDTSPYGFPSRERDWLRSWQSLFDNKLEHCLMMYPGADEVASVLVARMLNLNHGESPAIYPLYSMPGEEEIVAPYEDRPLRETVVGQIKAARCRIADAPDYADIILGVATVSPHRTDYRPEFLAADRETRSKAYAEFLQKLGDWQRQGRAVALADCAYPNGSDPLLAELLLDADSPLDLGNLAAYGAWNTAGNTLGTVIAQASCALKTGDDPGRHAAQRVFLAHRFVEDYGYQMVVRREARAEAERLWSRREPAANDPAEQSILCAFIERRLGEILVELQRCGVGEGLRIASGTVRLPWNRTFEVDFELTGA